MALCLFAFVLAGVYFGRDYLHLKETLPDVSRLQEENYAQQAQIVAFAEKISRLKGEMEKICQFNKKLKVVLKPDKAEDETRYQGQGGSETEEFQPEAALKGQHRRLIRQMHEDLDRLAEDINLAEQTQQYLQAHLESRKSVLAATPSILPCDGWVTSPFGRRRSPFSGGWEFHRGLDIANKRGTAIRAPAGGIVAEVKRESGYGRRVTIRHGYGLSTRYAHLHKAKVKVGQRVKRGQIIALMGNSGRSTGSHLHYEVWLNGVPVNPSRYILD